LVSVYIMTHYSTINEFDDPVFEILSKNLDSLQSSVRNNVYLRLLFILDHVVKVHHIVVISRKVY